MHVNPVAVRFKSRACLVFSIACLLACQKKQSDSPSVPAHGPIADSVPANGAGKTAATPDSTATDSGPAASPAPVAPGKLEFVSHPPLKAYPGKAYAYRPALSRPGAFQLKVTQGPDSSFRTDKGQVTWLPLKEGRYPIVLEAALAAGTGNENKARQSFTLNVEKVLTLVLKPFPAQVGKGDSVTFDLRGSVFPAWAAAALTVRFDYDGDGKWDTEVLPLAANLAHRHAYASIGKYAPKVEARYKDLETRAAEGTLAVVSAVTAALKISPDTVEPGGTITVDASASKGDGRLVYALDADGDGKPDWTDSSGGKGTLKAPGSGKYLALLTVRNAMGQEGKASAPLCVNAMPKLEFKVRNPRENMAALVELKARAKDADDSLAQVRVNYTGERDDWEVRKAPPDSVVNAHEWWLRFKHAYKKVGKYSPAVCVSAKDSRETCQKLAVEIFNAPPVCQPGPDLRATLGKPLEIDGTGVDPDGKIVKWEWDLDGDGKYDLVSSANGKFQYTFSKLGIFPLVLRVTTADGATATGSRKVEVRKKWKG